MKSIFTNWKTSSAAITTIAAYFLARKGILLPPNVAEAIAVIGSGIGLIFARDGHGKAEKQQ